MGEMHTDLHDGLGTIYITLFRLRFFRKRIQLIRFELDVNAHIGWHKHLVSKEFCITFDRSIRFNESPTWKFFNVCKNGDRHCIRNLSLTDCANVYAIKIW